MDLPGPVQGEDRGLPAELPPQGAVRKGQVVHPAPLRPLLGQPDVPGNLPDPGKGQEDSLLHQRRLYIQIIRRIHPHKVAPQMDHIASLVPGGADLHHGVLRDGQTEVVAEGQCLPRRERGVGDAILIRQKHLPVDGVVIIEIRQAQLLRPGLPGLGALRHRLGRQDQIDIAAISIKFLRFRHISVEIYAVAVVDGEIHPGDIKLHLGLRLRIPGDALGVEGVDCLRGQLLRPQVHGGQPVLQRHRALHRQGQGDAPGGGGVPGQQGVRQLDVVPLPREVHRPTGDDPRRQQQHRPQTDQRPLHPSPSSPVSWDRARLTRSPW